MTNPRSSFRDDSGVKVWSAIANTCNWIPIWMREHRTERGQICIRIGCSSCLMSIYYSRYEVSIECCTFRKSWHGACVTTSYHGYMVGDNICWRTCPPRRDLDKTSRFLSSLLIVVVVVTESIGRNTFVTQFVYNHFPEEHENGVDIMMSIQEYVTVDEIQLFCTTVDFVRDFCDLIFIITFLKFSVHTSKSGQLGTKLAYSVICFLCICQAEALDPPYVLKWCKCFLAIHNYHRVLSLAYLWSTFISVCIVSHESKEPRLGTESYPTPSTFHMYKSFCAEDNLGRIMRHLQHKRRIPSSINGILCQGLGWGHTVKREKG